MVVCYILCGIAVGVLVLYSSLDLNYFVRIILTVFLARFTKKKVHILDTTCLGGE